MYYRVLLLSSRWQQHIVFGASSRHGHFWQENKKPKQAIDESFYAMFLPLNNHGVLLWCCRLYITQLQCEQATYIPSWLTWHWWSDLSVQRTYKGLIWGEAKDKLEKVNELNITRNFKICSRHLDKEKIHHWKLHKWWSCQLWMEQLEEATSAGRMERYRSASTSKSLDFICPL